MERHIKTVHKNEIDDSFEAEVLSTIAPTRSPSFIPPSPISAEILQDQLSVSTPVGHSQAQAGSQTPMTPPGNGGFMPFKVDQQTESDASLHAVAILPSPIVKSRRRPPPLPKFVIDFCCDSCGAQFTTLSSLAEHKAISHEEKIEDKPEPEKMVRKPVFPCFRVKGKRH